MTPASIDPFTGRAVHEFWTNSWRTIDPAVAKRLEGRGDPVPPFSLSPLLGLARAYRRKIDIPAGQKAFFRISILDDSMVDAVRAWLNTYTANLTIGIPEGVRWKILPGDLALQNIPYQEFFDGHHETKNTPKEWRLEFLGPVLYSGSMTLRPFPLPEILLDVWNWYWGTFCEIPLPVEELKATLSRDLNITSFNVRAGTGWDGARLRTGYLGNIILKDVGLPRDLRWCLDLLIDYANYCGSGIMCHLGNGFTQRTALTGIPG